jgi:hypothetical protein
MYFENDWFWPIFALQPLGIDGRPSLSSFQSVVAREEIAAIDPDFVETEASIPDGMR